MNKVIINGKITGGNIKIKNDEIEVLVDLDKEGHNVKVKFTEENAQNVMEYVNKDVLLEGKLRVNDYGAYILVEKVETN